MKKSIKIVLILVLSIFLLFLGLAFYAYKKFTPEEIKKITVTALDKQFENARSEVGEVTLNFGFIFTVGFKGIKIVKDKEVLISIGNLHSRVPFYSVLFGAGAVDLNLEKVKINYIENTKGSNWEMKSGEGQKSGTGSFVFLANVKVNVILKDLDIFYSLKTGKKGEVFLSELSFFNLNFLNRTKFNAKSHLKGNGYSFNTNGEGEIDLSKIFSEKNISGTAKLTCDDFKVKMIPGKIPQITTDLTFLYDSSGKIKSDIKSQMGKDIIFDSKLTYFEGISVFEPMKIFFPLDKVIGEYGSVSFEGSEVDIKGKFTMTEKEMIPQLEFFWKKGPFLKDEKSSSEISGKLNKDLLNLKLIASGYGGSLKMGLSGKIDYNDPKKAGPFKIDLSLKDFKIKGPPKEKETAKSNSKPSKDSKTPMVLIPATVKFSFENISLMNNPTSGSGELSIGNNFIKISKMDAKIAGGKVKMASDIKLVRESKVGNFDLSFDKIDLKILNPYFPQGVGAVTGMLHGNLKGDFNQGPKDVIISNGIFALEARDGKIKEFNMENHIKKVFKAIPFLNTHTDEDMASWVTGDFQSLELNGKVNNEQLILDKIYFLGINKKIEIKGKGEVNKNRRSQVLIDFIDHVGKISGPIKKLTGKNTLSFKFQGEGYNLSPDYGYTIGIIGKDAGTQKLEDEGKKFLNKFLKKL